MLRRDQAREQLKSLAIPEGGQRRQDRVAGLPEALVSIAQPLTESVLHTASAAEREKRRAALSAAMRALTLLPPPERQKIFVALFSRLAPQVEQAWQSSPSLPYLKDKAYRAPRLQAVHHQTRSAWLQNLLLVTQNYDQDIQWYAAWAPYLGWGVALTNLGMLFAAAIDANDPAGDEVYDILVASARGEHAVGAFGHHVTRALLGAARADGWDLMEKMLLAAQRQEGLRQAILETVVLAHPQAFRRMLRVIVDNDLARFSATVRALDVWLGFAWDVEKTRVVNHTLAQLLDLIEHPDARARALASDDAQTNYLALWTLALTDVETAIPPAVEYLRDARAEQRFIGTHLLAGLKLTRVYPQILPMLRDDDLRIAARALQVLLFAQPQSVGSVDVFDAIAKALPRLPRAQKTLKPMVWDWMALPINRSTAAGLLVRHLGQRSPKELLPYLDAMDAGDRSSVATKLAELEPRDRETEDALLALVGDASHYVRERALKALSKHSVASVQAQRLEAQLTRAASDLRRGIIELLLKQNDADVLASAERLLGAANGPQRLAGLELCGQMQQANRQAEECRARVNAYRARPDRITEAEERLIALLFAEQPVAATLDDALGLIQPNERARPVPPRAPHELKTVAHRSTLVTPAAFALVESLDEWIDAHRTVPVMLTTVMGAQEQLLGNLRWGFALPHPVRMQSKNPPALPLGELWETWWAERPPSQRDDDGLELLRAWTTGIAGWPPNSSKPEAAWIKPAFEILGGRTERRALKYGSLVHAVITWLIYLHPPKDAADFLLDAVEWTFALIPADELNRFDATDARHDVAWLGQSRLLSWLNLARDYRSLCPAEWSDAQVGRLWHLLRWFDEPVVHAHGLGLIRPGEAAAPDGPRRRPTLEELVAAYRVGAATEADVLDHLLGSRAAPKWGNAFASLHALTGRKSPPVLNDVPTWRGLVDRCRERILAIETRRGELPTAASAPALAIRSAQGADKLIRLLDALGTDKLVAGYAFDSLSKASVLSHLIRVTFPGDADSLKSFETAMRGARIPEARWLEMAVYAPQWAEFIEHGLNWAALGDAVWWFHAHTKDSYWHVDPEIREIWKAQATERTPLTGEDLIDGAVDVEWFQRVYRVLGEARWNAVYKAARAGSGGKGYVRARLVADAMLGRVDKAALVARIHGKRHQDSVRALGLIPIGAVRERDVLERYEVIQEFLRTGNKFGAMRRQSEKRSATIAMENLARTAGYADPIRLEWAMEARAIADLADGSKTVTVGDVALTLAIDKRGDANLSVAKGDKPLKAVPAKLKKDPQVVELSNRKKEIDRQSARMRASLEQAMCRGDVFPHAELQSFCEHPLLRPLIGELLFTSEQGTGYPTEHGRALRSHDGTIVPIAPNTTFRIAHPCDLFAGREWPLWQRECFLAERIQPFKQVFRELYVPTAAELAGSTVSRRYAGQQVQTRQALALLGQRGWVNHPEEGVRRVFHKERLAAWVALNQGITTPAEVEGAQVEEVSFARRGDWTPLPLGDIPQRIFSEAMRDLDLVVSVAHAGGVDPEASASTVEMRASLVSETSALLKLDNVRVVSEHVLIEGKLGHYSVHLGSAVVHRQPGGMLCIVPVPAQHRGRLFLPFVDDDPHTAEVLSKVILLARDTEVRDPVILQQLQA